AIAQQYFDKSRPAAVGAVVRHNYIQLVIVVYISQREFEKAGRPGRVGREDWKVVLRSQRAISIIQEGTDGARPVVEHRQIWCAIIIEVASRHQRVFVREGISESIALGGEADLPHTRQGKAAHQETENQIPPTGHMQLPSNQYGFQSMPVPLLTN